MKFLVRILDFMVIRQLLDQFIQVTNTIHNLFYVITHFLSGKLYVRRNFSELCQPLVMTETLVELVGCILLRNSNLYLDDYEQAKF